VTLSASLASVLPALLCASLLSATLLTAIRLRLIHLPGIAIPGLARHRGDIAHMIAILHHVLAAEAVFVSNLCHNKLLLTHHPASAKHQLHRDPLGAMPTRRAGCHAHYLAMTSDIGTVAPIMNCDRYS
jgi:hypothetical protein